MYHSIWYHTFDQQPDFSGYYLAYRGFGIGGMCDTDSAYGYLYYDKKNNCWQEYEESSLGSHAIVYYWTDATPNTWVDNDPPIVYRKHPTENPALKLAWDAVQKAIEEFNMIRAFVGPKTDLEQK